MVRKANTNSIFEQKLAYFFYSTSKRIKINNENTRLKNQLQEQQRRVQNAKNEHQKRKKEHEKGRFQSFEPKNNHFSIYIIS